MRYGTEAFGGGYTSSEWQANNCVNDPVYYSSNCLSQALLADTTNYRDGTPLVPPQPNPLIWWQETSVPSLNANDEEQDQAVWLTYKHDYNLAATDTLHYWTVIVTEYDAYAYNLENDVAYAKKWYLATVRGCDTTSGCCSGRVGDANGEGEYPDEVTLGDIMLMVDVKFISGDCTKLPCVAEADVDQNGGVDPTCGEHVTLGDIMKLVDFLFITGPDVAVLPNCL
jgi:hypothetical protein